MMLIEAVGAMAILQETLHHAHIGGIGACAALLRQHDARLISLGRDMLEHLEVPGLGHGALESDALLLQEGVIAHHAHAHAALTRGGIFGAGHLVGRAVDVVLKDVVEEAHHVLDEHLVAVPLIPGFQVERGEAAHGGAVIAQMVRRWAG
jgi:hypothetical protein